ncbi:MAG: ABC transporter substrate-binding protein [Oceanicoccus sp.]
MKIFQRVILRLSLTLALSALLAGTAMAESAASMPVPPEGPHAVVEKATKQVMEIITSAKGYYMTDPQRFYSEIESILDEMVDFDGFSRGVMGQYASKKMYSALKTDEEKAAFKERMKRFSTTFRTGLVQTYAKGLLAFNGNRIDVLPPQEGEDLSGNASVTVTQHIFGETEKPYVVQYKLRPNRGGEWKLRNVTIEAINLGIVYRGQFSSAARLYDGDIDKVIENWSVDPTGNVKSS